VFPGHSRSSCTNGHRLSAKEQKTQQSPAFGFSTVWHARHSWAITHRSAGIVIDSTCLQTGHVSAANASAIGEGCHNPMLIAQRASVNGAGVLSPRLLRQVVAVLSAVCVEVNEREAVLVQNASVAVKREGVVVELHTVHRSDVISAVVNPAMACTCSDRFRWNNTPHAIAASKMSAPNGQACTMPLTAYE
jgi:hypothetical protein